MIKYYVYTREDDDGRANVYVEKDRIVEFADQEFDPRIMVYSGMMVETDGHEAANEAYTRFGPGELTWAEEPAATAAMTALIDFKDAHKKKMQLLELYGFAIKAIRSLKDLNTYISEVAERASIMSQGSKDPMSPEEAHRILREDYAKKLMGLPYESR